MKRNILLISPASDNEALWITGREGPGVKNNMPPLGLATIAAVTPKGFHVDIWDELVHGLITDDTVFERDYALVGITGYKTHLPRCRQLAGIFRKRSIPVAIGGPGVSGTPADYLADFDILFIGEAEKTWPKFLREWENGSNRTEYRQIEKIDLSESPTPNWCGIASDMSKYAMGCVQTTRGCPFDCDFCDVIYLFGRRARHKPIKNVLEEVKFFERLGMRSIFFNDDSFIGDRRYAKDLLRMLIPLNRSFSKPLTFSTQLTIDVSTDNELLELLADANFEILFIGIETPHEESLKETHKVQNLRGNLVTKVHTILSYGLVVRAGMIVGFDHDDSRIFDVQYDFIQKSFLPSVGINMLKAPFGTKLWTRLRQEGRVVFIHPSARNMLGHSRSYTNIIPKLMTRIELMKGYRNLLDRVYRWESFFERLHGFISVVSRPPEILKTNGAFKQVDNLGDILKVKPEVRTVINDIIRKTAQEAPYLLERVKAIIIQHAKYKENIDTLLGQIDRQIELETLGKLTFEKDKSLIPVTPAFKEAYREFFPDVYRSTYLHLKDKAHVSPALVEVFVDFLVRCGAGFNRLEDYHRSYLKEICERTCAKFNGQPPEEFMTVDNSKVTLPDVRRLHLGDDILKNVEQILITLARAGSGKESLS